MTIKKIAASAYQISAKAIFCLASLALVAGCSILPEPPVRADVYDFGPGPLPAPGPAASAPLPPIALAEVTATGLPEGSTALLYRLAYTNAQQLRPYTQARWSLPPAVLLHQAVRERLGQRRAVLSGDDGMAVLLERGRMPSVLRLELEEFSHVFGAPQASAGLVRVRAVLADASTAGETLVAQRVFVARRDAATPDAAGGAKALADAAAQVAEELAAWVEQSGR